MLRDSPLRLTAAILTLSAMGTALVGCGGQAANPQDEATLVVRDGALRELGADCSGAAAYLFIHAGTTLTVTDADQETVISAVLDPGTAEKSDTKDYGVARRVPTVCTFTFDAAGLEDGASYTLTIDERELGEYTYSAEDRSIAYPALGDPTTVIGG